MLVKILFIFIPIVAGEWELPEELRPPKELFLRVGGFSPFVGFRETEKDLLVHSVRTWLSEALETKYSPIVFGESDEKSEEVKCLMPFTTANQCFTANKQQLFLEKNESQCFSIDSEFLKLKTPDKLGNCVESKFLPSFGKNTFILCRPPCQNPQNDLNFYESFLRQQLQSNQSCFCDHCVPVVEEIKAGNASGVVVDGLQIRIIETTKNVSKIQTAFHSSMTVDSCLKFVTTTIEFLEKDNINNLSRFSLQRGRFHCPNEVTCPWEIFYVFFQDDPLFNPSYVFTIIIVLSSIFTAYAEKPMLYFLNKM